MEFPFTSQGTRDGFSLDTSASKISSDVGRAKFLKTDGGAHRTKIYDQIVGRDSDAKEKLTVAEFLMAPSNSEMVNFSAEYVCNALRSFINYFE